VAQFNRIAPYNEEKWRDTMAKRIPNDTLIELISRFPEGASLEEVMLGLTVPTPRRTVQRWLAHLVKEGEIETTGKARARRYIIHPKNKTEHPKHPISAIPLSKKGIEIQNHVSLPIQARTPVSYERKFLEKYQPNITHYLPEQLRTKLNALGNQDGNYPAGTYARQIFHRLLIDLSWNSSRLEGNTYSLLETERLLEFGKVAEGKDLKETQMILNHKAAIEFVIYSAEQIGVNRYTILNLHTLLSDNLMPDPSSSGRLRSIPVGIGKSVYQPSAIPQVIEECFNLLIHKANQIEDPMEQAFFLMVQLPYLQPFDDVNKRTSRLAANIPLIRNNLCPLSFIDVPLQTYINGLLGVYELNRIDLLRDVFEWAYERSCILYSTTRKTIGEPDPFRMKYRSAIQHAVREIISNQMNKTQAVSKIRELSDNIPRVDKSKFIEVVERELQSLHEGNIARYQIRPIEYENWVRTWQ
jgi:Fic family protein